MDIHSLLLALQDASFAVAIREGADLFPWIETLHVLAITLVVGTISIVDLRLLGVAAHAQSLRRLLGQLLPVTWVAFSVAVVTGFLMFSSAAVKYAANWPFRLKMLALAAAALNMLVFHFFTYRSVDQWDDKGRLPASARMAGLTSLSLWIVIIVFGRWIGFTLN